MKYTISATADRLRDEYDDLTGREIKKYGLTVEFPEGFPVMFAKGDFYVVETNNPVPFFVRPNQTDPENPTSVQDVAEQIKEMFEFAIPDPENPDIHILTHENTIEPESYYGKYVPTLKDALHWIDQMINKPVREWDKEYNLPIDPVMPKREVKSKEEIKKSCVMQTSMLWHKAITFLMVEHKMRARDAERFMMEDQMW